MSKPVVLPDQYNGEGSWDEWVDHFQSIAALNEWEDAKKLLWLKVRLTGKAKISYNRLSEETKESLEETLKALRERYEPESRRELYMVEFQTRRKQKGEGWADFAQELKTLVDKAWPALQDEARECLALNHYLAQIDNPQIAFSVKQKRPTTLTAAVSATLEMESYLNPKSAKIAPVQPQVERNGEMMEVLTSILQRLEKLEARGKSPSLAQPPLNARPSNPHPRNSQNPTHPLKKNAQPIKCHRCGEIGHFAKGCANPPKAQGN